MSGRGSRAGSVEARRNGSLGSVEEGRCKRSAGPWASAEMAPASIADWQKGWGVTQDNAEAGRDGAGFNR